MDAGGSPKFTEYPGVKHNSWDKAYATDELWTWLFEQVPEKEALRQNRIAGIQSCPRRA